MRIATSTIYTQQTNAMDNLISQYQSQGNDLSTGKTLNAPSDDPTQIAQDLEIRSTITLQKQESINVNAATNQLTSTDTVLANLTSLLQTTQTVAQSAVNSLNDGSKTALQTMGTQIDTQLNEAIGYANTQYAGSYIFAGTQQSTTAPVTTVGEPVSVVNFSGNEQAPTISDSGQTITLSPTLQQAFNYDATDGSPSVFQTLINLRDTLNNGTVTDQSATSLNRAGDVIYGSASPAASQTTLGTSPTPFSTAPVADSAGDYTISINNTDSTGAQHVESYTFNSATYLDSSAANTVTAGVSSSIVGAINANSATTGLSAVFNPQTQRLTLTNVGGGSFSVTDEQSTGATNTSNLTSVLGLSGTASLPQTISTQLGDIANVLSVALNARAIVGSQIDALSQINTLVSSSINNNITVQSGIEDTNVPSATSAFSATQVALTASYSTTTRLEAKDLFDYL